MSLCIHTVQRLFGRLIGPYKHCMVGLVLLWQAVGSARTIYDNEHYNFTEDLLYAVLPLLHFGPHGTYDKG